MQNYTTEELIQYLYHETSEDKTQAIERALQGDFVLREKYSALKNSTQALDSILESPRPQSIMAILNYAKRTAVVEQ